MLVIGFKFTEYTVAESSGIVQLTVTLSGGSSITPISVMVTTIELSATGEEYITFIIYDRLYTLLGFNVDFDSNPIDVTFAAGEVSKRINIPVMCDKIVERAEKFDTSLMLTSNNHQVKIGRDRSTVKIIDSTGKQ